jgi:hypothetical protein
MTRKYTETDVLEMLKKASGTEEEPLVMPTMNFSKEAKKTKLVNNGLEFTDTIRFGDSEEEPLIMPAMNFGGQGDAVELDNSSSESEKPLLLPEMKF